MKMTLIISAGIVALLFAGQVYAGENIPGAMDRSSYQMITNEDLPTVAPYQDGSTLNQTPRGQIEGSSPGGVSDTESTEKRGDEIRKFDAITPMEPGHKPPETDRSGTDIYGPEY